MCAPQPSGVHVHVLVEITLTTSDSVHLVCTMIKAYITRGMKKAMQLFILLSCIMSHLFVYNRQAGRKLSDTSPSSVEEENIFTTVIRIFSVFSTLGQEESD